MDITGRAAKALFDELYKQSPVPPFGYADADDGATILDGAYDLTRCVHAVLQAIREPSEEMVEAGFHAREHGMTMSESAEATWRAMIDTALN